ncbi:hypothetical protein AMJ85_09605 [candidate division BRC1 bacterium SM23_51]|nr:MAG: hypothetical protein AMJ85_09605 [candidate division BRC1 bacterium SM23_51]
MFPRRNARSAPAASCLERHSATPSFRTGREAPSGSLSFRLEVHEAAAAIELATEIMERYDERYMEAKICRHRGELALLGSGDERAAETRFEQAIAVAESQEAKSLELRATMSLARLWQGQGRQEEAHRRLAGVYDRFTEGFDTPDLMDAKALLSSI